MIDQDTLPKTAQETMEIVDGGSYKPVVHRDNSQSTVKVLKVPRKHLTQLGAALQDEDAQIRLYTGQDQAWVESLSDASYELLIEEGQRLNFPSLDAWLQRQKRTLKMMGVDLTKVQEDLMFKLVAKAQGN